MVRRFLINMTEVNGGKLRKVFKIYIFSGKHRE
jgi:hypothetical protein